MEFGKQGSPRSTSPWGLPSKVTFKANKGETWQFSFDEYS